MDIEIAGLKEIQASFTEFEAKVIAANTDALLQSAKVVKSKGEKLAPRASDHSKSGPQHKGHKRSSPPNHMGDSIPIGKVKKNKGNSKIDVGWKLSDNSEYMYAKWVEFGTSKMPPRPFLQEALDDSEGEILSIFNSKIGQLRL